MLLYKNDVSHGPLESCLTTPELTLTQDWEEQGEVTMLAQPKEDLERIAGISRGDLTLCHLCKTQEWRQAQLWGPDTGVDALACPSTT